MKASNFFPSTRGAFGMFDSVEIIPASPSYDEDMQNQYTGTMIDDLYAQVDNTLALIKPQPWEILAAARIHLTNQVMDAGDVQAWWMLGKYQDCFVQGKTDECRNCGEMEGLHHMNGTYCRNQRDHAIGDHQVSYRFAR